MKSVSHIIEEVSKNELLKEEITAESKYVKDAINFYERYPQYQELPANAIFFIRASMRLKGPVKVHRFENGSIYFVGDLLEDKEIPLASIGTWQCQNAWHEELKKHSTIIEEIEYP